MFEENHTLTTKTASEENEDCAGLEGGSGYRGFDCLADLVELIPSA